MENRKILTYDKFTLNEVLITGPEQAISVISAEPDKKVRRQIIKQIAQEYFSDDLIFGRTQLSLNSQSQDVSVLQTILKSLGYLKKHMIDAKIDQETMLAVQSFANKFGISVDINQPIPLDVIKILVEFDSAKYDEKQEVKETPSKKVTPPPPASTPISMPQSSVIRGEGAKYGVNFPSQKYENKYKFSIQYSREKDGEKNLSPNFKVKDFVCKDGTDIILINPYLIEILEKIRAHFGKPLSINSGYRTPPYNRKIGGAGISQHMFGNAADFRIDGVTPLEICTWLNTFHTGGIGLYVTKNFTHVDVRNVIGDGKATWSKPKGIKF
jgi:uncharacterized protein YcbK (DUF882 family)